MNRLLLVPLCSAVLTLTIPATTAAADPIEGSWKTIDDKTGNPRSVVEISVIDGKLYGKIVEIFPDEGEDPDPICEKCPGDLRDQKIIGMVIINGLEEEDGKWSGGKILDPENGKSYRCKLWVEDGQLRVRGSLLIFHRTQTWLRVAETVKRDEPWMETLTDDLPVSGEDSLEHQSQQDSSGTE